jgi:ribosomal protein S18 acetylase RimI-like enzyme
MRRSNDIQKHNAIRFSIACSWDDLPKSALSLLESRNELSPFSGATWFKLFSQYVAPGQGEIRWFILQDESNILLLLPMLEARDRNSKILKSLSNYYTPYFNFISFGEEEGHLLRIMVELARDFLKQYDAIELYPLTHAVRDKFSLALANQGFYIKSYTCSYNWRREQIRNFEEYWSTVNSRLRHTVKRKQKKFEAQSGIEYSIIRSEKIDRALVDYHRIYSKSWKTAESHPQFIDELVHGFSENGALRLGFIHKQGVPVATQLWLVSNGTAYIYKLAYDPAYEKYSVGTLLSRYLFEAIITADNVHTIDYLTGDDGYKADWMNYRRELYGLQCSNLSTPRGLLSGARSFATVLYKELFGSQP